MKINPLWWICLFVRISLIFIIRYLFNNFKNTTIYYLFVIILFVIGTGFIYKGIYGSNNEIQFSKVFWHDSRIVHGVIYLLSVYYLVNGNINMNSILLFIDIVFSITYRFVMNK
jgi:hypothetical protein